MPSSGAANTAAAAGASAAEICTTLQVLAKQMLADGHPMQAIKCYLALLSHSMLPSDEAAARLRLGQLLMQHTMSFQDAKQHLQRAELLAVPLNSQHILKCEVFAALASIHKLLDESDFERHYYSKGLEQTKDPKASNQDRRCLSEWGLFFQLRVAESMISKGQTDEAVQQVAAAMASASTLGLLQEQVVCSLFLLQLAILQWDRKEMSVRSDSTRELLQQLEQQQHGKHSTSVGTNSKEVSASAAPAACLPYFKLHFNILETVIMIQSGNFKDVYGGSKEAKQAAEVPPCIAELDKLLQQLPESHTQSHASSSAPAAALPLAATWQHWLPVPVLKAGVHLLAAMVDKPGGKQKQAQARIDKGLKLIDCHVAELLQDKATASGAPVQHKAMQELHTCLALRIQLLETRQQFHLLSGSFAAARMDAAESIRTVLQFPSAQQGLRASVHLQAALYAQAVGAQAAAARHFKAVACEAEKQGLCSLASDGRSLAAISSLAQRTQESVDTARDILGPVDSDGDTSLAYGSRCVLHTAAGILQLSGSNTSSDDKAEAKQHFSKALKIAHSRLHNHQVVSQLLMLMAPLQAAAADASGAKSMLSSCVQLSHGAGDLHTQVSALAMLQQLLAASQQGEEEAKNRNYRARKEDELSSRIQEAESDAQQHQLVLTWDIQ